MRLTFQEGLELFESAPLELLQKKAQMVRNSLPHKDQVTFIVDSNPNYTNICSNCCTFCAFWRPKGHKDGYFKSVAEVMADIERAEKNGAAQVLLQGAIHEGIDLPYMIDLLKTSRSKFPTIHPHFFSAPEIVSAARNSKVSIADALTLLWQAGLRTIPGGGAEILSDRIRNKISPKKITVSEWIDLHETAHRIGYKTTATMMYGHIEEPSDVLLHLDLLRKTQDETHGFSSFIPWSFKQGNSRLTPKRAATHEDYLRIIAFARIYLDNFPHIGASWFSEGKEIGVKALSYGADDFGGTLMEENVHAACGYINKTTREQVIDMIRSAGCIPAERNAFYEVVKIYS